jgi:HTH-type transcriptional regulator/antitoxin MqsA
MKTRVQCPHCGDGYLRRELADLKGSRKGESFTVEMDALVCPNCGFKTVPRERAAQFALRIANAYRNAHGLLTSMEIKDLRARLCMTQKQFTDFLGAGQASVKRWELGEIQSKAMDRLMRLSAAEKQGASEQYGRWGGFEQLQGKTALQVFRKRDGGTPGMPHGPPSGTDRLDRSVYWLRLGNDNLAGTKRAQSRS